MSSSFTMTQEKLHAFYKTDRELFSRLVLKFMRDPTVCLLVMALWMWLERRPGGYRNLIVMMLGVPDRVLNALADEAVLCLKCLDFSTSNSTILRLAPTGGVLLTPRLVQKEISLQMFVQNRFTTVTAVKSYLTNVCARIFTDILQKVLPVTKPIPQCTDPKQPLVIPGFPHPVFGALNIFPKFDPDSTPTGRLWDWTPVMELSIDDKTMFLTFSRGFPVTAKEVKELFAGVLGVENCAEDVHMETVPSDEQPLYAKMVLSSVPLVDQILKGNRVSKFRINGKHIWARKYERRDYRCIYK